MSDIANTIKEKISIIEIIGAHVKLKKAGASYKGLCPFHAEKTPSFSVSPERNSYYCFGCGAKGDVFNFLMEYEGLDFKDALKFLADRAGVDLSEHVHDSRDIKGENRMQALMEDAVCFFEKKLTENKDALNYARMRSLKPETIKNWRLGYAPSEWRALYDAMIKKGYTAQELKTVGLIKEKDGASKERYYDTFRDRLMFPIFSDKGKPIAFSGRILTAVENQPKYLNSPDTPIFNKSRVLYGFDRARKIIRSADYAILVEGQMDLLMSYQAGMANTIASSGTALTEEHVRMISNHTKKVIIAYDGDNAGIKASYRASELFLAKGFDVKIAVIKEGKDPGEVAKNPEKWKEILKNANRVVETFFDLYIANQKDAKKKISLVHSVIFPLLKRLESNMELSHYVGFLSDKLGMNRDSILSDFEKYRLGEKSEKPNEEHIELPKSLSSEEAIFGLFFMERERREPAISSEIIAEKIKSILGDDVFEEMLTIYSPREAELCARAEDAFFGKEKEVLNDMIMRLTTQKLDSEIEEVKRKLSKAEKDGDKETAKNLLDELSRLSKKKDRTKRLS